MPWRNTRNPYLIWLSEIILQQTRVAQGMDYYLRFVERFPTVVDLANASEDEVLKLWQGLGYYSRARNLHATAKIICKNYDAQFPTTYEEVQKLKGIGDYTAAAICSFAYNLPHAVLDGNVFRFLSRYFGVETPINSSSGKKEFSKLAQEILNIQNPAGHNQAIMEFGALHCTPLNPKCEDCPFKLECYACANQATNQLPVKIKNTKIQSRYFYYFILKHSGSTFIQQRTDNDIWKGLFQFPLLETNKEEAIQEVLNSSFLQQVLGSSTFQVETVSEPIKHILSHRHIHTTFITVSIHKLDSKNNLSIFKKVEVGDLNNFAWPRVIDRYFQKYKGFSDE